MTHRLLELLRIAIVLIVASWANHAIAHGVTIKVQHALPADSAFHTEFLVPWAQKIDKDSGGRLHFQLFPAMQMGGTAAQLFDQVKAGDADIVYMLTAYTADRLSTLEVFELPFMGKSAQGSSQALWEYLRTSDRAHRELDGVRVLAVRRHDAPQFHMRDKPIRSAADLNGLKIGTPARVAGDFLTALGASPVAIPIAQIPDAIADGKLDGMLLPWEMMSGTKLDESLKYHSEADPKLPWLYSSAGVLAMNAATYKSLPDDLKKVISANSGAETSVWLDRVFDARAGGARKLAAERGDAINALPAEELAKWQTPARAVIDAWLENLNKRGLNGSELIENARVSERIRGRPQVRRVAVV